MLLMSRAAAALLIGAALLGSAPYASADSLAQPAESAPVAAAPAPAFPRGALFSLQGTPHVWAADQQGVLHWVGDLNAMVRQLALERDAAGPALDPSDFVFDAAKRYYDLNPALTLDQLRGDRKSVV